MQHVIKKQLIHLLLPPGLDNFRIQQRVSEHYQKNILHQLQEIFDSLTDDDETIFFDTIEIDLGIIALKNIEAGNWSADFILKLTEYLNKMINAAGTKKTVAKERRAMGNYRQWMLYMKNGYLPWNSLQTDEAWYEGVLQTLATDIQSVEEFRKVVVSDDAILSRIILQHNEPFLVSLIETLTAEKQKDLPAAFAELYTIYSFLNEQSTYRIKYSRLHISSKKAFIKNLWKLVLLFAAKAEKNMTTVKLAEKIITAFPLEGQIIGAVQKELAENLFIMKPVLQDLYQKFTPAEEVFHKKDNIDSQNKKERKERDADELNKQSEISKEKETGEKKSKRKKIREEAKDNEDKSGEQKTVIDESPQSGEKLIADKSEESIITSKDSNIDSTGIKETKTPGTISAETEEGKTAANTPEKEIDFPGLVDEHHDTVITKQIDEEGIFVQHAGLVLLHPFLHSFFKRLQFVAEGNFIDLASRQKALHLLHFLASGEKYPEEHMLVIAKVLCAHPVHHPVDKEIDISDAETDEAINLLAAAIEQWEILKNTSPDGLREGFLQRRGKLYRKNDSLYLHVESSSIDILLDQLPWNLGMIQLPWMKEMLRVEWR